MNKFFLFCIIAFSLAPLSNSQRILQILRVLSNQCNNRGYLYKSTCFCVSQWTGPKCAHQSSSGYADSNLTNCDDLAIRLDYLTNISPDFYLFDDDEFPRISKNSIDGSSGDPSQWTKMHDLAANFHLFSTEISALDIGQGGLGDCYLLAAYASLANRNNGSLLRNMFVDVNDNPRHVYTSRWMINGKPRYVAVDDWVPGYKASSSYSHIQKDGDAWPLILEKAYAKIHGSYQIIEGGNQNSVWTSMLSAPSFYIPLSQYTEDQLFNNLTSLFSKNFVVGCATYQSTHEVGGHAYAVLGAYTVKLDNGSTINLIRYFNPWHSEFWTANPWADGSANWTPNVISQVPYVYGNDGITYSTVTDFKANFYNLVWAESRDDYDVSFIDFPLTHVFDNLLHKYMANFTYFADSGNDLYIFIDQSDGRIWNGCSAPITVSSIHVAAANGTVYKDSRGTVKIPNAAKGQYKVIATVSKAQTWARYFTVTSYSKAGGVNFIPQNTTTSSSGYNAICPNNCNLQGRCNTATGICTCYFGYTASDCGQIKSTSCADCSAPSVCDTIFGVCLKPTLYNVGQDAYAHWDSNTWTIKLSKNMASPVVYTAANASYYFSLDNKYLLFSGSSLIGGTIMGYSLNSGSNYQKWPQVAVDANTFVLSSALSATTAITVKSSDLTALTTATLNKTDPNQQWRFAVLKKNCPNNCSSNGVCSVSTGTCVCGSGWIGDACNLVEPPVQCPNSCSGNGVCSTTTGTCNCNANYVGQACDILYRDLVCPLNCSFSLGRGSCNLASAKCVCVAGFTGQTCQQFDGKLNFTIKNVQTGQYLDSTTSNFIVQSTRAQKWSFLPNGAIVKSANPKKGFYLYGDPSDKTMIAYFGVGTSPASYQTWTVDKVGNNYLLRTGQDPNYVIGVKSGSVYAYPYSATDLTQQWILTQA